MQTTNHIVILAYDALGDSLAANLANQLHQQTDGLSITGMGGNLTRAAGVEIVVNSADLESFGLMGFIKKCPTARHAYKKIKQHIVTTRPQLVILVDYPALNLRIAKIAKKIGCQVLYYVSPKNGSWHHRRIKKMKRYVDHIAVLSPFEKALYQQEKMPATYVGHPMVGRICDILNNKERGEKTSNKTIALLPGSQQQEIGTLLPPMIKAAAMIHAQYPEMQFILPLTKKMKPKDFKVKLPVYVNVITDAADQHIASAICAICAAGTVALETALLGIPHVIIYKTSWLNFTVGKYFIRPTYIGLSNIVAQKKLAPELTQKEVSAQRICQSIMPLLNNKKHRELIQAQYNALLQQFKTTTDHHLSVADIAANLLREQYAVLTI